jgi:hypothetical protein
MSIIVHYNNYKDEFPLTNGCLSFKQIIDEYCLSIAFKGNFQLNLSLHNCPAPFSSSCFTDLQAGQTYKLSVVQDLEADEKHQPKGKYVS